MTIDEYEAIRLIDLEGLTQEKCAEQMAVARTTAQAIYASARKKIAQCIVEGRTLSIGGGEYRLCERQPHGCGRRGCQRQWPMQEGTATPKTIRRNGTMKIAVTYENGQVFQHFGKTAEFKVYSVEDGKVVSSEVRSTNGNGHGALAGILSAWEVSTLICGGIGQGAKNALAGAGIQLYGGTQGNTDELVQALLAGNLEYNADVQCNHHHGHGEGSSCGHHHGEGESCGHHHGG